MLHVLNGDSARMGLERSGIPGTFVVWPDVLYEGPTPLATGEDWIQVRARHLASLADLSDPHVIEGYRKNDAALEAFRDHDEVVFWLEHDLFDQLLLIRHLWWLGLRCQPDLSGPGHTRFSLVCRDIYLGPLQPEAFPPLFESRQPITMSHIATGSEIWRAFCAADPTGLARFAVQGREYTELPYLKAALLRHLEEFPSLENGLSRTESLMLRVLLDAPLSFSAAFRASTDLEDRMFMGDLSFWQIAKTLAAAAHPLVAIDPAPNGRVVPAATFRITDTGRDVQAGRADQIELNGIDRWLGGAHLTRAHGYRWSAPEVIAW
jgi:hypothetical protein